LNFGDKFNLGGKPSKEILMKVLALLALLMLGACTTVAAGIGGAKNTVQTGTDIQAQTTLSAACAITYGAFTRLPSNQQLAVELACGGDWLESLKNLGVVVDPPVLNEN
jgi:hypothetical protein